MELFIFVLNHMEIQQSHQQTVYKSIILTASAQNKP